MSFFDTLFKKKKGRAGQRPPDRAVSAPLSQEAKVDAAPSVSRESEGVLGPLSSVLRSAVVSEKSAHGESRGVYTFAVSRNATKRDIAHSIKKISGGVFPLSVRVLNREGKRKQTGRHIVKRADTKRAMVKMPKGVTLSLHEGV